MRLMPQSTRENLIWMVAIGAVAAAILWITEGPIPALTVAGWLAVFGAVLHLGRKRSETIKIMGGMGDERIRTLSTRALAFAGGVMAVALPTAWLVTVMADDENYLVGALTALFAASFVAASVFLAQRG